MRWRFSAKIFRDPTPRPCVNVRACAHAPKNVCMCVYRIILSWPPVDILYDTSAVGGRWRRSYIYCGHERPTSTDLTTRPRLCQSSSAVVLLTRPGDGSLSFFFPHNAIYIYIYYICTVETLSQICYACVYVFSISFADLSTIYGFCAVMRRKTRHTNGRFADTIL